ncbi:MAG TPA: hypothetical protein PKE56_14070, partial [Acidimicrobiales bacterium]|nr:hypothetical protein [Acidimicrobiales bacterium]
AAENLFQNLFFNSERYDLSAVGRVKFNRRVGRNDSEGPGVLSKDGIIEVAYAGMWGRRLTRCSRARGWGVRGGAVPGGHPGSLVGGARRSGVSLQTYLAAQLALLVATPTVDEVLDRLDQQVTGRLSTADALEALAHERAGR